MQEVVSQEVQGDDGAAEVTTPPTPPSRKRSFAEVDDSNTRSTPERCKTRADASIQAIHVLPTPPLSRGSANESLDPAAGDQSKGASPSLNTVGSMSCTKDSMQQEMPPPSDVSSVKKRKVTAAEKEQPKQETDTKETERAEQRAKRDTEKGSKEEGKKVRIEGKRKRNEEKEARKREKEVERAQKEEQKRKLEEEKGKKERSQRRINAFFPRPSGLVPTRLSEAPDGFGFTRAHNVSASTSPSPSPRKSAQSDFDRDFLPYALQSHTSLAPYNPSMPVSKVEAKCAALDKALAETTPLPNSTVVDIEESLKQLSRGRRSRREKREIRVKDVMSLIQGSSGNPIDLTGISAAAPFLQPEDYLQAVTMKYLHFAEDIRPPYVGTYTKIQSNGEALRLSRNPFRRELRTVNYEYDSEAEWEEPGEGEDLDSEGEEDAESLDDDNDMAEFLDDEDAEGTTVKKGQIWGQPGSFCSGLIWEDENGRLLNVVAGDFELQEVNHHRMEVILNLHKTPIDPFSTSYWHGPSSAITDPPFPTATANISGPPTVGSMPPPRLPLRACQLAPNRAAPLELVDGAGKIVEPQVSLTAPKASKVIRLLEGEDLAEFKRAVDGSKLKRAQLLDLLRSRFPKTSQKIITDTLRSVAARVGLKEDDKKWTVLK